ncbi:hypothetical protein MGU_08061 [Metarhizium guizhouense ARSEF 977]|uniref:Uncharacterized protein n=1 Tax=Metarhizium guizhouense (strain ARSEF 977) TaxID=1276136 RepID=A0A0B4H4J8_METGA|nr:hypothetical protein MGU_08061 [Metarhizium guizhouense ARSEF 977]
MAAAAPSATKLVIVASGTPSRSERRATAPRACSPAPRSTCPTSRPRTTKPSARWAS